MTDTSNATEKALLARDLIDAPNTSISSQMFRSTIGDLVELVLALDLECQREADLKGDLENHLSGSHYCDFPYGEKCNDD